MKAMRRAIDAAVEAIKSGPLRRWFQDRLRGTVNDQARARFARRAQAAWQAGAIPEQLGALRTSAMAASLGVRPRRDRRDIVVAALIAATVATLVTAAAFAVATVVRSRGRDAMESVRSSARRVAVPVVVPDGEQDDELRSIRGIGTVSAERLRGIGITTVAQIAAWRPEDIQRIAGQIELSPERIEREDWVGQARAMSGVGSATDLA